MTTYLLDDRHITEIRVALAFTRDYLRRQFTGLDPDRMATLEQMLRDAYTWVPGDMLIVAGLTYCPACTNHELTLACECIAPCSWADCMPRVADAAIARAGQPMLEARTCDQCLLTVPVSQWDKAGHCPRCGFEKWIGA